MCQNSGDRWRYRFHTFFFNFWNEIIHSCFFLAFFRNSLHSYIHWTYEIVFKQLSFCFIFFIPAPCKKCGRKLCCFSEKQLCCFSWNSMKKINNYNNQPLTFLTPHIRYNNERKPTVFISHLTKNNFPVKIYKQTVI